MLSITEALPNEYNIIQDIAYTTWPICYGSILSKPQLEYMLDKFYTLEALNNNAENGQVFILAKENDVPLGFAAYEHNYKGKNVTRVHKLYVLPETQGKGLGLLLIKEIEKRALQNGSEALSLNVNKFNPAQSFYKKLGYAIVGAEDIEIGQGYLMEDFIMEKPL